MQKDEPFTAMGVAAYALMQGLVTGMVQTGQKEAALAILDNACDWLAQDTFVHSTKMQQAHEQLRKLREQLVLLGHKPGGAVQ